MADNETITDIIAWLRKPREGENAYLTLWRDEIADRLEAAHKREVDKLNSVIQAQRSAFDAEQDRQRRAAPGDAAKLREALMYAEQVLDTAARNVRGETGMVINSAYSEAARKCRAALAAPARECDKYTSLDEARNAYMAINEMPEGNRDEDMRQWLCDFHHWLFALAKKGGAK